MIPPSGKAHIVHGFAGLILDFGDSHDHKSEVYMWHFGSPPVWHIHFCNLIYIYGLPKERVNVTHTNCYPEHLEGEEWKAQ